MGIPMQSDLDILGGLTPIKYPRLRLATRSERTTLLFPPTAKTLAVLEKLRYIHLVYSGGLHEEER